MTANTLADSPVESDRKAVEHFLKERLARCRIPSSTGVDHTLYVRTIGEHDELRADPALPVTDRAVVPVYLYGSTAYVGPLNLTGAADGPCVQCLPTRWQKLRPGPERDALERGGQVRALHSSPFLTPLVLDVLWQLVRSLVGTGPTRLAATGDEGLSFVYELRLDTLRITRVPILPDASCPGCGVEAPSTAEAARLDLRSRPKKDPDAYRVASVHDYRLPMAAIANPVCGMLGIAAIPDLQSTTTAPVTGYMFIRGHGGDLHDFFWSGHADSYDDSTLLAALEGLERGAGLRPRDPRAAVLASYREVTADAVDPRECGVYADDFYRATAPYFVKFTDDLVLPWVWGYSLRDERPVLVPERRVFYMGRDDGANYVQECSNGCASGGCVEEAILYGLLELIERDAFLLAWYGKAPLPEIDPDTCASRATRLMIERVRLQGYDVRLFDNRIDLPIPVVTAVAVRRDGGLGTLCFASGASLDPEDAIRAALCEIASYLPSFEQRTRDDLEHARAMAADYLECQGLHDHPLLFGLPEMAHFADFLLRETPQQSVSELYADWLNRRPHGPDLRDDLLYVRDVLVNAGHDVIAVDQTSADQLAVGTHSVCTVVPGLLPIDFGWSKQRALYMPRMRQALRRAGFRATDLDVLDMNLVPHPFP